VGMPAAVSLRKQLLFGAAGRVTAACSTLLIAGPRLARPSLHCGAAAACTDATMSQRTATTIIYPCTVRLAASKCKADSSKASNVISGYTATLNQPQ
jgi:hypothetical protein